MPIRGAHYRRRQAYGRRAGARRAGSKRFARRKYAGVKRRGTAYRASAKRFMGRTRTTYPRRIRTVATRTGSYRARRMNFGRYPLFRNVSYVQPDQATAKLKFSLETCTTLTGTDMQGILVLSAFDINDCIWQLSNTTSWALETSVRGRPFQEPYFYTLYGKYRVRASKIVARFTTATSNGDVPTQSNSTRVRCFVAPVLGASPTLPATSNSWFDSRQIFDNRQKSKFTDPIGGSWSSAGQSFGNQGANCVIDHYQTFDGMNQKSKPWANGPSVSGDQDWVDMRTSPASGQNGAWAVGGIVNMMASDVSIAGNTYVRVRATVTYYVEFCEPLSAVEPAGGP